ncbi:hypothetical protein Ocin01_08599 [Orchesella cincta]|uniref:CHK kinase-like domain-containing protein n=1 Tax=Orchesella cincta TaxID=48709 RepID=A0A1D2MYJ9_ORCCI|nr:hypothetical protein Ocin01_08599 [Orchesella cincta]
MKVPEQKEDITLEWLNSIFKPHRIHVYGFSFAGDASKGRGFMGSLEQVELEISQLNSSADDVPDTRTSTETLSIILKTLPNDPMRKSYAANDGFSSREVSMYTEVFKAWDEFLDTRQVPSANRFRYPLCYYGAEEGERDTYKYILVFENLTAPESHFQLWAPGFIEPLSWKATSAVIQQIAKFHATGIAYKLENHVESYYNRFPKLNHTISPMFQMMWDNAFQITKEVIQTVVDKQDIPHGLMEQLDKLHSDEQRDLLLKWFTSSSMDTTNLSTICHHDLHSNNVVLSKDNCEAILFDYQSSCVFNPMKDLSFFLVLNCEPEYATTNISRTFQVYHDTFAETMRAINVDFQYSMENIENDYYRYLVFSLTHVMTAAQIWVTGPDSTEVSKRRFAMAVIEAFRRGVLEFPTTTSYPA